ncbi:hypothetical protein BD780_000881 [Clostridium tetanomorphum]|nr:hypothetical protein [Clostridium tetanomorphum]
MENSKEQINQIIKDKQREIPKEKVKVVETSKDKETNSTHPFKKFTDFIWEWKM